MELVVVGTICTVCLGLGVWAVNALSPGLEKSRKFNDRSAQNVDNKEK